MNSQLNHSDQNSFKITFADLQCKINLNDSTSFAFVIRIGKTSSKYTQKKEIHEGTLIFNSILEVPIDQSLLALQSPRKQKCEIMLYKFRINRDKESKELIGMASAVVSNEMFEVETKKLRLTNSFDKEAFFECKMKIELGEADVLSQQPSQLSSFVIRSDQPSINNELTAESRVKQKIKSMTNTNHVKVGLITSNSQNSLREVSSDKNINDNSFLELLNGAGNSSCSLQPKDTPESLKAIMNQVCESPKLQESNLSNNNVEEENIKLKEMCKNLQEKNHALQSVIVNLESQAINQSFASNRSSSLQIPQIPKPGANSKRSPMIKKNTVITATPSFSKLQPNEMGMVQNVQLSQQKLIKPQSPKKMGQIIKQQASRLNISQQDNENERSCSFLQNRSSIIEDALKFAQQNTEMPLQLTFAGQRMTQRHRFQVKPLIQIKYTPPAYPSNFSATQNRQNRSCFNQSSTSSAERPNNRSYTKFNGKRKYHVVGAIDVIKNQEDSQINMSGFDHELEEDHKREGGSIIVSRKDLTDKKIEKSFLSNNPRESPFNQLKAEKNQNEKSFLDFLKDKDENSFLKNIRDVTQIATPRRTQSNLSIPQRPLQERQNQNQLEADADGHNRSRLTLQELDIKTEEKFRKNERMLKISNMKILQENRTLKNQRKMLQKEIEEKKSLTHEEFQFLRVQISKLKSQINQSLRIKDQSELKCQQFSKKVACLEEENTKLKKDLKQQKAKYDYYFRMGNINDDKEKQRENYSSAERTSHQKKSSEKIKSEASSPSQTPKTLSKNDKSMTSISNFTKVDKLKTFTSQSKKSSSKIDYYSIDKIDENKIDANSLQKIDPVKTDSSKQPTSSTAISKLKMHIKPTIPKPQMNGAFSQIHSPIHSALSANMSVHTTGLIGTGQTIIVEGHKTKNFFSRK